MNQSKLDGSNQQQSLLNWRQSKMYKVHKIDTAASNEYYEVFVEGCTTRADAFKAILDSGALDDIKVHCQEIRDSEFGDNFNDEITIIESDLAGIKSEVESGTKYELKYLMVDNVILAIYDESDDGDLYGAWYNIDSDGKVMDGEEDNMVEVNEDVSDGARAVKGMMLWGHYIFC